MRMLLAFIEQVSSKIKSNARNVEMGSILTMGAAKEAGGLPSVGGWASTWVTIRLAPSITRFTVWCRTAAYRRSISTCADSRVASSNDTRQQDF